jgi:hypothetical protein
MAKKTSTKTISAEEFDRKFDAGENISAYVNWSSARPFYKVKPPRAPAAQTKRPKAVKTSRTVAKAR